MRAFSSLAAVVLTRVCASVLLVLCLAPASASAQVPQLINYQGRVAVNGVNFNNTGYFKFGQWLITE